MVSRRRLTAIGIACAMAVAAPAVAGAERYVLVEDDWGGQDYCSGDFDHVAGMALPASPAAPLLQGLDSSLFDSYTWFSPDGTSVAWLGGRALRYGDLRTGVVRRLASARRGESAVDFAVGPHGRSAILSDSSSHVVLVARSGTRTLRHRYASDYDTADEFGLSPDGRFAWYATGEGETSVVRPVAGGPGRRIGSVDLSWAPGGDRLAYVEGGAVRVLDARSGRLALDLPLPPDDDASGASWSPDGRFLLTGSAAIVDVAAGRFVPQPQLDVSDAAWRPRRGHQLLRIDLSRVSDLLDVARGVELWRHGDMERFAWSPDGRWLLALDAHAMRTAAGRLVGLPRALRAAWRHSYRTSWLADGTLQLGGSRTLWIASPPAWRPRVLRRAAAGHELTAAHTIVAAPAGLSLLQRAFGPRARMSDC